MADNDKANTAPVNVIEAATDMVAALKARDDTTAGMALRILEKALASCKPEEVVVRGCRICMAHVWIINPKVIPRHQHKSRWCPGKFIELFSRG